MNFISRYIHEQKGRPSCSYYCCSTTIRSAIAKFLVETGHPECAEELLDDENMHWEILSILERVDYNDQIINIIIKLIVLILFSKSNSLMMII